MKKPIKTAIYPSLEGKSVLITGGATGIGEEIVRGFVRQQSKVAFLDIKVEAGVALGKETGANFHECDLKDVKASQELVAKVAATQGDIDILINNAAHDERHAWEDVTVEYWEERHAINIRPTFFVIQAVAPGMIKAKGGSIINFGSSSWMLAQGNMPGYTSAKAGIHGITRSFARDLGKHGIRVNTIVPGWVMTQRQKDFWVTPESLQDMANKMCLAGEVMSNDIANMALWLGADDSKMCSAQNYIVDGGWI